LARVDEKKPGSDLHVAKSGVISVDNRRCLECRECEVACSLYHEGECSPSLSRIHVIFDDFVPSFPTIELCKQCTWPACYYACTSLYEDPAMYIDPRTGARTIDEAKCTGCGSCAAACPLMPQETIIGYRQLNWKRTYFKCDLCKDRANGPVCVEACPSMALTYVPATERGR